ncbi:MAG: LOG family protein [Anaerolineales bacterium]|jgi:uncharacterized protein (TIGR00730 family)
MNVTVYGGSQPPPASAAYEEAYELGKLLAQASHTVLTGGYIGTMEAVSRGAAEAGGHVIGVTCDDIEAWRAVKPNAWVQEERRFPTMQERLNELVLACDAAIALPGGPGTLTEVALTWNLMIVHSIPPKPLILTGPGWKTMMAAFFNSFEAYIPQNQRDLLKFAPDIISTVALINS